MQQDEESFLRQTAAAVRALLAARGWKQRQLADALGIDQPWISKLLCGKLGEVSERVELAHKYATLAFETDDLPPAIISAIRGYIVAGGDVGLLAEWIWSLAGPYAARKSGDFITRPARD